MNAVPRRVCAAAGALLAGLSAAWTVTCAPTGAPPLPALGPVGADADTDYLLPYPAGMVAWVGQGNFGVLGLGSHAGTYAIDFVMPEGTPVLAARGGTVIRVRNDCPDRNCPFAGSESPDCCGNHVIVRHADDTRASYWHLRPGGACVVVGQSVSRGDVLGRSGNTGISLAPHLHFELSVAPGSTEFAEMGCDASRGFGDFGCSADRSTQVRFADVCGDGIPRFGGAYASANAQNVDHCAVEK